MKQMLLGVFLSSVVFSSEGSPDEHYANIKKGNWSLSGSIGNGFGTGEIGLAGHLDFAGLYYVSDKLSLGVTTTLMHSIGIEKIRAMIGPAIQYDFLQVKQLVLYTRGSVLTAYNLPFQANLLQGQVGMNYFITPSISIGHSFGFGKFWGASDDGSVFIKSSSSLGIHF